MAAFQKAGFQVRERRGSDVVMVKEGLPVTLSVPDHRELRHGTLRTLIRQAGLSLEEFLALL